jgi:hypothetical protein
MKADKVIGVLMLVLTVATIAGMILADDAYWSIYNVATALFSVIGGVVLLKQK